MKIKLAVLRYIFLLRFFFRYTQENTVNAKFPIPIVYTKQFSMDLFRFALGTMENKAVL